MSVLKVSPPWDNSGEQSVSMVLAHTSTGKQTTEANGWSTSWATTRQVLNSYNLEWLPAREKNRCWPLESRRCCPTQQHLIGAWLGSALWAQPVYIDLMKTHHLPVSFPYFTIVMTVLSLPGPYPPGPAGGEQRCERDFARSREISRENGISEEIWRRWRDLAKTD